MECVNCFNPRLGEFECSPGIEMPDSFMLDFTLDQPNVTEHTNYNCGGGSFSSQGIFKCLSPSYINNLPCDVYNGTYILDYQGISASTNVYPFLTTYFYRYLNTAFAFPSACTPTVTLNISLYIATYCGKKCISAGLGIFLQDPAFYSICQNDVVNTCSFTQPVCNDLFGTSDVAHWNLPEPSLFPGLTGARIQYYFPSTLRFDQFGANTLIGLNRFNKYKFCRPTDNIIITGV